MYLNNEKNKAMAEEKSRLGETTTPQIGECNECNKDNNEIEENSEPESYSCQVNYFNDYQSAWDCDHLRVNPMYLLPYEKLPYPLNTLIDEIGDNIHVDKNMVTTLIFWALSSMVGHKYRVRYPKSNQGEPLCLWTLILANSGAGKSATASIIIKEIRDIFLSDKAEWEDEYDPMIEARNYALKDFENGKFFTKDSTPEDKVEIKAQFDHDYPEPSIAKPDYFLETGDVTNEYFVDRMNNQGRLIGITTEGAEAFEILEGKYTGKQSLAPYTKAYSGEPTYSFRKKDTKNNFVFRTSSFTWGVLIQPDLFFKRNGSDKFRSSGFDARFLTINCETIFCTVYEAENSSAITETVLNDFQKLLRELHDTNKFISREDFNNQIMLDMDNHAQKIFLHYKVFLSDHLRDNKSLVGMDDFVGKQTGKVLRLAGILHCVKYVDSPQYYLIDRETILQAIEFADCYLAHSKTIFGNNGYNAKTQEAANKILDFAKKKFAETQMSVFSNRDLVARFSRTKGLLTHEEKEEALNLLINNGEIERVKNSQTKYKLLTN